MRFDFDPETDVFGFCGVFWYHSNSVMNREGTKRCHVLCGSEIWVILCVIFVNSMLCEEYHVSICYLSNPCRKNFYWALLTPLWDPLSGTGGV